MLYVFCLCQNERSVRLLQEYSEPDLVSLGPALLDLDEGEDLNYRHSGNHNGQIHQQNEVSTASLQYITVSAYYFALYE
jgi:hypothetical protein